MKTTLYIPTLNAGSRWAAVLESIATQTRQPDRIVVIDSGSTDATLSHPLMAKVDLIQIDKRDFDHGGTRQMAIDHFPDADIYLLLTQDAILANSNALAELVEVFVKNPQIGAAYGRQLPHQGAQALESHARLFNYPAHSFLKDLSSIPQYGIKTASCSNSFSAYRKEALHQAGGFPSGTILGEDVIAAGRIVLNGWKLAYVSEAQVFHSHSYSLQEEFKRYFDIGVFHATNPWIFAHFGQATSEGKKYVKSELAYVSRHHLIELPKALFSIGAKWLGYQLGLHYEQLPTSWKQAFSMHKAYWKKKHPIQINR